VGKKIGEGSFGVVFEGLYLFIDDRPFFSHCAGLYICQHSNIQLPHPAHFSTAGHSAASAAMMRGISITPTFLFSLAQSHNFLPPIKGALSDHSANCK
jgi:hypothetical protein